MSDGAAGSEGRRPKASRGGNRGQGHVGGAAITYGDLIAAGERSTRWRGRSNAAVGSSALDGRRAAAERPASKDEDRSSWGEVFGFERASSWPHDDWRDRGALSDCAVGMIAMTCRSSMR